MRLWTQGSARVLCNEHLARDWAPTLAAIGMEVPDPAASVRRARLLGAPSVFRRTRAGEQDLVAFRAPEGTEIFFADPSAGEPAWVPEFDGGEQPAAMRLRLAIDHVNLAHPWQTFEESVLFHTSVLALRSQGTQEVAAPTGLVRSRVMRIDDGAVRLALNVAPAASTAGCPQHVAFSQPRRDRGRPGRPSAWAASAADPGQLLRRPRRPVRPARGGARRDARARRALRPGRRRWRVPALLHAHRRRVFFELVQRDGGYDGYGAAGAPVRLAAQHLARRLSGGSAMTEPTQDVISARDRRPAPA